MSRRPRSARWWKPVSRRLRRTTSIALCFLILLFAVQTDAMAENLKLSGHIFGTTYHIEARIDNQDIEVDQLQAAVDQRLARIDQLMSTWKEDSEVSRFNKHAAANEWFPVSEETANVVKLAQEISNQTNGYFDITVAPLVRLWNFGSHSTTAVEIPSDMDIENTRQRIGMDHLSVEVQPPRIRKDIAELELDLSAIAKGYAVDKIYDVLAQYRLECYLIEIGGELRTRGENADGTAWRVGIEAPIHNQRSLDSIVLLRDQAMATSGDYRNFFQHEGQTYSHTIDPHRGRTVQSDVGSVTVFASTCAQADALATALMAMGDAGESWAESHEIQAIFLRRTSVPPAAKSAQGNGSFRSNVTHSVTGQFDRSRLQRLVTKPNNTSRNFFQSFIATAIVFGLALGAMSIGVIIANRRLRGTCGGLAMTEDGESTACSLCTRPTEDCLNQ